MPHDKIMRVTPGQNQVAPPPSQARQRIRSADISRAIFKSAPHAPKPRYHFNEHPRNPSAGADGATRMAVWQASGRR